MATARSNLRSMRAFTTASTRRPRPIPRHLAHVASADVAVPRRDLCALLLTSSSLLLAQGASADVLRDLAVQLVRPEDIGNVAAVVRLLDAKSVLRDVQALARTPLDSQERFNARVMLPGYAKRLREVGPAVGTLSASTSQGASDELRYSERYGGSGEQMTAETAVLLSVGRTITISGRTIQEAALAEGATQAEDAMNAIEAFLKQLPPSLLKEAQDYRIARAQKAKQ